MYARNFYAVRNCMRVMYQIQYGQLQVVNFGLVSIMVLSPSINFHAGIQQTSVTPSGRIHHHIAKTYIPRNGG